MTGRRTVVVVDDAPHIRVLVRRFIETLGDYDVVGEAGDGEAAVSVVASTQPDFVVLDLAMPVMDGLEALPLIAAAAPAARVIMLTGFGTDDTRAVAAQSGAAGFVDKGPDMGPRLVAVLDGLTPAA